MQQDVTGMNEREREISERMVGHCRSQLELFGLLPRVRRVSCHKISNILCQIKPEELPK